MRKDAFDRGLVQRRAVLGADWVERATHGATGFTAPWQDFITRTAWGEVWGREGLPIPTRRLLAMMATLAHGHWEEFEMHVRAALRAAMPVSDLQDMLMLAALYCGVPAANEGYRSVAAVLTSEGHASPAAPLTPELRERRFSTFSQPQLQLVLQGPEHGTPVLLCHALGLDASMWSGVAAHLASRGHPVLRYDLRGHGGSEATAEVGIEALVDDAARVVREWGLGPVVCVGLSLGGMVAQGLAIRHPALLRGLVLSNTVAVYPQAARERFAARAAQVRSGGMEAVIDELLQRYLAPAFRERQPVAAAELRARLMRCPASGYAACCEALAGVDWSGLLSEIRVPTWVVSGAADQAAPVAAQVVLAQGIARARHTVLDCAHLPTMERPEAFIAGLDEFLDSNPVSLLTPEGCGGRCACPTE